MKWYHYAVVLSMIIGATIFHDKYKNSKFIDNIFTKVFCGVIMVVALLLMVIEIYVK